MLFGSAAAVKRHLANDYEKVGVRSRTEAVRIALEKQCIGLHETTSADEGDGSDRRSGSAHREGFPDG